MNGQSDRKSTIRNGSIDVRYWSIRALFCCLRLFIGDDANPKKANAFNAGAKEAWLWPCPSCWGASDEFLSACLPTGSVDALSLAPLCF